jgi:hypothetical protein
MCIISPIKAAVMLIPLGYTFLMFRGFFLPRGSAFCEFLELTGDACFPVLQYLGILFPLALIPSRGIIPVNDFIALSRLSFYISFKNLLICPGIFVLFFGFGILKYKKKKRIISGE